MFTLGLHWFIPVQLEICSLYSTGNWTGNWSDIWDTFQSFTNVFLFFRYATSSTTFVFAFWFELWFVLWLGFDGDFVDWKGIEILDCDFIGVFNVCIASSSSSTCVLKKMKSLNYSSMAGFPNDFNAIFCEINLNYE